MTKYYALKYEEPNNKEAGFLIVDGKGERISDNYPNLDDAIVDAESKGATSDKIIYNTPKTVIKRISEENNIPVEFFHKVKKPKD